MMVIRVGLLGYGHAGKMFHAPLIASISELELVAIASRDGDRVRTDWPSARAVADPVALATADDVDLIVIATPNSTHAPLARAALGAGKHVVVDKPFTVDLREARMLVAMAERTGQMLSVFHNRRWDSDFLTVRRAIEAGMIGDVGHFESHMDRCLPSAPMAQI